MLKILFVPRCELRPFDFFKGCLILFFVQCAIYVTGMLAVLQWGAQANFWFIIIFTSALIYPYYCLYGKQLDALKISRLWFLPIAIVFMLSVVPMYTLGATVFASVIKVAAEAGLRDVYIFASMVLGFIPLLLITYSGSITSSLILGFWKKFNFRGAKTSVA